MKIKGSTVFITGASRGIGLAVCCELINAGAKVFLTARSESELSAACKRLDPNGGKAFYAVMDVSDSASVKNAVSKALELFGKVDLLINNAGITSQQMVVEQDFSFAEKEIQINYLGTFLVTQTLLPSMLERKSGMIINVASTIGKVPALKQANYCASKAAVIAFSSSLRSEVEDYGITVKTFIPGVTSTDMMNSFQIETSQVMSPEEVAVHMMKAIDSRKAEYICGSGNRGIIWLSRFSPEWARKIMKGIVLKSVNNNNQ